MALDKQKILSELGNVVNQLQSADCGCMGKIFNGNSNAPNSNSVTPGAGDCRHGCCHCHGYNRFNTPCSGETRPNMPSHYNNTCMGRCNPAKLYTDTYQYLNQNLMQPVVQEVYNDLKTLTPANTVMSNQTNALSSSQGQTNLQAMPNKYGTFPGNVMNPASGVGDHVGNAGYMNTSGGAGGHTRGTAGHMGGTAGQMGGTAGHMAGTAGHMAGTAGHMAGTAGHMEGTAGHMAGTAGHMGGTAGHMGGTAGHMGGTAGYMGGTVGHMGGREAYLSTGGYTEGMASHMSGMNGQITGSGGNLTAGTGAHMGGTGGYTHEMGQNIVNMMMSSKKSNVVGDNPVEGGRLTQPMVIDAPQSPHGKVGVTPVPNAFNQPARNIQENVYNQMQATNLNNPQVSNVDANPLKQMVPKQNTYGQHTPGISKFNDMFPGVMQNFGDDLGFDPMAIAVQMNPANHQRAAIDTMSKLLNENKVDRNKIPNTLNPAQWPNTNNSRQPPQATLNQPQQNISAEYNNQILSNQPVQNQGQINYAYSQNVEPQQTYTTLTPAPEINQQLLQQTPQQVQDQQFVQQQYISMDPNTAANNEEMTKYGMQPLNSQLPPDHASKMFEMEKEPIFPANASPNQAYSNVKRPVNYTYNTLGQPVEMLPAKRYHVKDPGGPQTLSPQHNTAKRDPRIYSNVKSTVSKASIMGNRPTGRNPSKTQLQHIYNQYGGSQSLTHQNISGYNERSSNSEGKLNIPQRTGRPIPNSQILVEKVGGDTMIDNNALDDVKRAEPVSGQFGDVPNQMQNNALANKIPVETTMKKEKTRNGLQDLVYTSYPTSTAWSFHGNAQPTFVGRGRLKSRI
ncbi:uncharacterized protein [Battus philenor]|uniref:uncharacterized protein n=1 Tax=Battus philenor TaxID=42288 RepID=UPI0035CF6ACD